MLINNEKGKFDVIPQLLLFTNDSHDFSDAAELYWKVKG